MWEENVLFARTVGGTSTNFLWHLWQWQNRFCVQRKNNTLVPQFCLCCMRSILHWQNQAMTILFDCMSCLCYFIAFLLHCLWIFRLSLFHIKLKWSIQTKWPLAFVCAQFTSLRQSNRHTFRPCTEGNIHSPRLLSVYFFCCSTWYCFKEICLCRWSAFLISVDVCISAEAGNAFIFKKNCLVRKVLSIRTPLRSVYHKKQLSQNDILMMTFWKAYLTSM